MSQLDPNLCSRNPRLYLLETQKIFAGRSEDRTQDRLRIQRIIVKEKS